MTEAELKDWKKHSCILEVDLKYPKELHDLHNEYPLAPERVIVNKVEKLIPNLNGKTKYVLHYENLKLYESLGMKVTEISSCKMPILGQVALNDPAQNPIWETSALNDPTSEQLKEISQVALNDPDPQKKKSLKHPLLKKKLKNSLKKSNPNKKKNV